MFPYLTHKSATCHQSAHKRWVGCDIRNTRTMVMTLLSRAMRCRPKLEGKLRSSRNRTVPLLSPSTLFKPLSSFICFDHFKHQENGKHGSRSFRPWWRKEKVPKTRTGETYLRFKMSSHGVSGRPSIQNQSQSPLFHLGLQIALLLVTLLLKSDHSFGH